MNEPFNLLHQAGLDDMFEKSPYVNPYFIFYKTYGKVPCKRVFHDTDKQELLAVLKQKYSVKDSQILRSDSWKKEGEQPQLHTILFPIAEGVMIYFNPGVSYEPCVEILYHTGMSEEFMNTLVNLISSTHKSEEKPTLYLLCAEHFGLDVRPFEINKSSIDIQKHYNNDFIPVHERIFKRLQTEKDKGLVLLHGEPGTGKTTYIRHLISVLDKKKMIYVPPDLAHRIADPNLLSLLAENPDSILIIEDAENILMERSEVSSGAMSNLLNLADGLLADCLNIQIICTFNIPLHKVDKALTRKGRIIASYEMNKLNAEKSAVLIKELHQETYSGPALSLSDIYNWNDPDFTKPISSIGFR
jgi:hypothetical protein